MTNIGSSPSEQDRQTGALSHVVGILGGFMGSLLFYYVVDDKFVKKNAAEAANWQISMVVYTLVLSIVPGLSSFLFVLLFSNFFLSGVGAKRAQNGQEWSYPLSLNLLSVDVEDELNKHKIKDEENIERVKKLYRNGVIDEEEMEDRIGRALRYNESREKSDRLSENPQREYSYN